MHQNYLNSTIKMVLQDDQTKTDEKKEKKENIALFMARANVKIKKCVHKLVHITQTTEEHVKISSDD